jgi:hypothetical protein
MARFEPGQSGNPGGRPKDELGLRELARTKTRKAIETLESIMTNKKAAAAARVTAACALLDRGWGKPTQRQELSGPNSQPISIADGTNLTALDKGRRLLFCLNVVRTLSDDPEATSAAHRLLDNFKNGANTNGENSQR